MLVYARPLTGRKHVATSEGTVVLQKQVGEGTVVLQKQVGEGTVVLQKQVGEGTVVFQKQVGAGTVVLLKQVDAGRNDGRERCEPYGRWNKRYRVRF